MAGRPKVEIDPDEVRELAAEGNTQDDIALMLGICKDTLHKRRDLHEAYMQGMAELRGSIRHWQVQSAREGNTTMQIWLGKILCGQREETVETIKLKQEDDALTKALETIAEELDEDIDSAQPETEENTGV